MKALPILAAVLGIGVMAALVGYFGAGAVIRSLFAVGGLGFAAICAIHLALMVVMGLAWRVLMPGAPSWVAIWGRLVRDSGSEVLPLSQVGGYVLGARALALAGVHGNSRGGQHDRRRDLRIRRAGRLYRARLGPAPPAAARLRGCDARAYRAGGCRRGGGGVSDRATTRFRLFRAHRAYSRPRLGRTQRRRRRGIAWRLARDLPPPGGAVAVLRAASGMLDRQRGGGLACLALGGRTIAVQRRAGAGEHALRGANIARLSCPTRSVCRKAPTSCSAPPSG